MVNHLDGHGANNLVSNLEWATAQRNSQHAFATGLTKIPNQVGEQNSSSKLTEDSVHAIRSMYSTIGNCAEIARQFGLNPRTVWDICHNRRWKHI
jgi:hypothetical protein